MTDPSIERFRRVVASAYASLDERREEINDLNVFPVADGDTGDNMALTMRAVMDELDRLNGRPLDDVGREEIVGAVARAALMGARGNSGVILSQIVRGAAAELASRPGELVDPQLVSAAISNAVNAAYESVQSPVEGTMLTVLREMSNAIAQRLAHMERSRLRPDAGDAEQDELLAEILEVAMQAGEAAVDRTPQQLQVLADAGVVDAGAYGLVLMLAGAVTGLRGDGADVPAVAHHEAAPLAIAEHADSRYRYCVNFVVTGEGLASREFVGSLEALGDSVAVVGDASALRVHVHTDDPSAAREVFAGWGEIEHSEDTDMRRQIYEREERLREEPPRTAVVAVVAGDGMGELFRRLGAEMVAGGSTLNPSADEILRGIDAAGADHVVVLPNSPNVILAAQQAAELSEHSVEVVPSTSQQAGLAALVEYDRAAELAVNAARLTEALESVRTGSVAPAARDDPQGRFVRGDAVGFVDDELVAWGGAGTTLVEVVSGLAEGSEIVTVIEGDGAPVPFDRLPVRLPANVELEVHRGGQPSYWWLIAAQ